MPESLAKIAERLRSVQEAAEETAASYEERESGEGGSEPEGKRWGELSAGTDELAKLIGEAAGEADELADTYKAELS